MCRSTFSYFNQLLSSLKFPVFLCFAKKNLFLTNYLRKLFKARASKSLNRLRIIPTLEPKPQEKTHQHTNRLRKRTPKLQAQIERGNMQILGGHFNLNLRTLHFVCQSHRRLIK